MISNYRVHWNDKHFEFKFNFFLKVHNEPIVFEFLKFNF